ncbi:hypothetical protein SH449x_004682 [Pirellulaceae bacterium SH449]
MPPQSARDHELTDKDVQLTADKRTSTEIFCASREGIEYYHAFLS